MKLDHQAILRAIWTISAASACILALSVAAFSQPGDKLSAAAKADFQKGSYAACFEEYSALISTQPKNSGHFAERARCHLLNALTLSDKRDAQAASEFGAARADAAVAIRLDAKNTSALIVRAVVKSNNSDEAGAIEDLTLAISIDPQSAKAYYNRAKSKLRSGDTTGALSDLDRAIGIDPKAPAPYIERGLFAFKHKDLPRVIADLSRAIELGAGSATVFSYRGRAYLGAGKAAEAIADLSEAIKLYPNSPELYFYRTKAYKKLGKWDEAVSDSTQVIHMAPNTAQAYVDRGESLVQLRRAIEGIADFNKALELDPDNRVAASTLEKLRKDRSEVPTSNSGLPARSSSLDADFAAYLAETDKLKNEIGRAVSTIDSLSSALTKEIDAGARGGSARTAAFRTADQVLPLIETCLDKVSMIIAISNAFSIKYEKAGIPQPVMSVVQKRTQDSVSFLNSIVDDKKHWQKIRTDSRP